MVKKLENLVEIANPEEPHLACVLLLDTSGSMVEEDKITLLNEGIKVYKKSVLEDNLARKRVELAVITFGKGGVQVIHDFSSIEDFEPQSLDADGYTPMGEAILKAIELVEQRKQQYKDRGIDYYRPWIFLITDGEPTDMRPGDPKWNEVVKSVYEGEANGKFLFFAVGVLPANMDLLRQLAPPNRPPALLREKKFKEMFLWLSKSHASVSASRVGEQVRTETPKSWAEFSTH